jgi:hypothetical protein
MKRNPERGRQIALLFISESQPDPQSQPQLGVEALAHVETGVLPWPGFHASAVKADGMGEADAAGADVRHRSLVLRRVQEDDVGALPYADEAPQ